MPRRKTKSSTSTAAPPPARAISDGNGPSAWAAAGIVAFFIGAVYGRAISTPFIFDDFSAIHQNSSIHLLWPLVGVAEPGPLNPPPEFPTSGRPLVNLSFAINYFFGGLNATGYHVFNLALHYCAAMMLWGITRRCLRLPCFKAEFESVARWLALAVALLWSLHPLQTEAVIYVTQRSELMMATCYLATLYCSLRYWEAQSFDVIASTSDRLQTAATPLCMRMVWLALAITSCLAGMASKQVMVSAPLIVLMFDRAFVAGSVKNAMRRSWPFYLGLAATWILLLFLNLNSPHRDAAGFSVGVNAVDWWLTQSKVFFMYLRLAIRPWPLLIHYHFPYLTSFAEAWQYVVPLFLIGCTTLVLLARNRPLGFLGTWFFAILAPTFVIPIVTEMAAERRMYLALAPLIAIFVVGGYRLADAIARRHETGLAKQSVRRPLLLAVGGPILAITLVFSWTSSMRAMAYHNELDLWLEILHWQPENPLAHQSVAAFLERGGDDEAAITEYREAIRLHPNAAQARYQLGALLQKRRLV